MLVTEVGDKWKNIEDEYRKIETEFTRIKDALTSIDRVIRSKDQIVESIDTLRVSIVYVTYFKFFQLHINIGGGFVLQKLKDNLDLCGDQLNNTKPVGESVLNFLTSESHPASIILKDDIKSHDEKHES